jgi:hypothetical protein
MDGAMMWLLMRVPRVVLPPESNLHLSETSKDAHGPPTTYRLVAERERAFAGHALAWKQHHSIAF